jgi:hypothetical protein
MKTNITKKEIEEQIEAIKILQDAVKEEPELWSLISYEVLKDKINNPNDCSMALNKILESLQKSFEKLKNE